MAFQVIVPRHRGLGGIPLSEVYASRREVVSATVECGKRGLIEGSGGNLSKRILGSNLVAIKGTGVRWQDMTERNVAVIDISTGKPVELPGEDLVRASCEALMHFATYFARPDIQAFGHTHTDVAMMLASRHKDIVPNCPEFVATLGQTDPIRVIDYSTPSYRETAKLIAEALIDRNVALMKHHGLFAVGANLTQVFDRSVQVERSAIWARDAYILAQLDGLKISEDRELPGLSLSAADCALLDNAGFEAVRRQMATGQTMTATSATSGVSRKSQNAYGPNMAAVLKGPKNMVMEELGYPVCGKGEMIVRVSLAAICGSDLRLFNATKAFKPGPILHEGLGEIVEMGNEVEGYKLGERVMLCAFNPRDHAAHFGYNGEGYSSMFIRIRPEHFEDGRVLKIPHALSDLDVIMTEAISCVMSGQNAVKKISASKFKDARVVILGAGPIGNMHAELAWANGAKQVIISEPNLDRVELARQRGVKATFLSPASIVEDVMTATEGHGADVVITAVSKREVAEQTMDYVADEGVIMMFAGVQKGDKLILNREKREVMKVNAGGQCDTVDSIDLYCAHYDQDDFIVVEKNGSGHRVKQFHVIGSTASTPDDFRQVMEWIEGGKINPHKFITHVIDPDELPEVLAEAASGSGTCKDEPALKIVVDMGRPYKAVDLAK